MKYKHNSIQTSTPSEKVKSETTVRYPTPTISSHNTAATYFQAIKHEKWGLIQLNHKRLFIRINLKHFKLGVLRKKF